MDALRLSSSPNSLGNYHTVIIRSVCERETVTEQIGSLCRNNDGSLTDILGQSSQLFPLLSFSWCCQ